MPNDSAMDDAEIIHTAYAERVREAFKIFADNLGVGENEKLCRDRFVRSLDMVRKATTATVPPMMASDPVPRLIAATWRSSSPL